MGKIIENYTNQHELQTNTKKVINSLNDGSRMIVLRYTKPVAVILSINDYKKLISKNSCPECIEKMKLAIENKAKEINS